MTTPETLRRILQEARTVAVLGAHTDPGRAAFYVPDYLKRHGYRVIPVNATKVGRVLHGEPVRASLTDIDEPVDVVDVFRRSEAVPGHVAEILAMKPLPRVVWLQSGIRNEEAAERLRAAGIEVVQDRCMMAEHRALF